ncbi:hypothetical protein [Rhodococcus erythropolis]|uniref:hypothetical protein n=1 Tax=Rhodococcus erythropolis TaxID=1833 RepID=UPI001BEAAB5B|nr:hypothetical protein [Rhodococcus erythropolis]MBT2264309.1 hypothetical protein [Rhodococcus erythropolis]
MDRYKITMPDGASTDEWFDSDGEAIECAVDVNRGKRKNVVVERYATSGRLIPTALAPSSGGSHKKHQAEH